MNKKIILPIIILLLGIGIYQGFFKKEKEGFNLAEVVKGNISQEISDTGQVKKGEEINLSFKNSGKIKEIYVKIGEKAEAGQILARIDTDQLEIQLESARQKLEDTIATTNEKIEKAYKDALSNLDDSYLKIYNCFIFINLGLKRTYFERGDVESIVIAENKETIEKALNQAKFYIQKAKNSQNKEDIDIALSKVEEGLLKIKTSLEEVRNTTEGAYGNIVSITDKNTLDTHRLNINTCHSNIVSSQATISLTKVTGEAEINAVRSQVLSLENQLQEAILISPTDGEITKINKRIGEIVQPTVQDIVISLIPEETFLIEVNIYEEDIIKMNIGNPVDISLIAFPDQIFKGKVISIDPAEKLIEGVVYYKVTIDFEKAPEGLKPGMTADLVIKTASKENVLIIPKEAIQKKDEKTIVQVLKNGLIEERQIETGLRGSNNMVEVISGLNEGETVILK